MFITDAIYHDANKAREHLEALHWPNGPVCPHCGNCNAARITKLAGKSTRPGVHKCKECAKPFTVTVGTIFEDSKIPLNKWLLAFRLLSGGKKGMSAHELHRALGITYKSAWFLCHRIREAMDGATGNGPLGGADRVVEADETYVGGKAKNRAFREPAPKKPVVALIERDGQVRSFHVANVTAKQLRGLIVTNVDRASHLMTDESHVYTAVGREFNGHSTVNHSAKEYVKTGGFKHSNTAENFFSIFKRGVIGTYHHMSEAHLGRYCKEFDFRYNTRAMTDSERAALAVKGAVGKRLMYQQPRALAA